ncbi:MAG: hypothetical protein JXQ96_09390 [Cyclobacteriaceae bacterium]
MNKNYLLAIAFLIFATVTTCKTQKELVPTRVRQVRPSEVSSFHKPLNMTIAWYPYKEQTFKRTSKNEWKIVKSDSGQTGNIPVILIKYPETQDSVWLDMNTESALLGKLLKHSLMTQEPIKRPFGDYLQTASCTKCHPSDVKVDFDK